MKKNIFLALFCLAVLSVQAQTDSISGVPNSALALQKSMYLYPEFNTGEVHFKNGAKQQAQLNYNAFFQQMIFQQNGVMMAIENADAVDTIILSRRKFIPVDTLYFEVKTMEHSQPYFIMHNAKVTKAEQTGSAYSGISATGSAQTVDLTTYRLSAQSPYQLRLPVEYNVEHSELFFIKQQNRLIQLKSSKQMKDLFPGKEAQLKKYIKDNNINFSKESDIQKLLLFVAI